ncbi:DegT/DnrJ/EryC1/StrS family aminotransferase [Colwellia sp. BRX10-6]|uniref:DegT/DnrJ/EryC1/StrS aminotransferase family protein n=1 Tax=unclassified Colwellia TaxID=196834 RepID=UPI0015F75064|nr:MULTISPECIES: DegT/DnrJ/EryC1/StrS family aminotransferase [unclassified Colwellia]MBA6384461.1 DegT/DnrJ/EryC1/StrS family aminotransferase [Colwellia sp. BRX10-9]MBA6395533.1 DegT/DnrJ/EryC1/StrS family aminotransferase [Colwellia sp. BRX10-6]
MTIKLNQPIKPNLEKLTKYLEQVNDSGWYTNFGPLHQQLTQRLEAYLGVENLLLVSNGTLALQVAYKALNVKSALTTPFSFVATASSLIWQGIETSFSDIDKKSYNLCPKQVQKVLDNDSNVDTIVATHVYGNPCDINRFDDIGKKYNINIIYDASHAFAVNVDGKSVLSFGDASTLSFHATKVFHTVEGGAIVFKRKADFERAKRLINFGIDDNGNITEAGINAKLNEYQCAVGLSLLDEIDNIVEHRATLFEYYRDELKHYVDMPLWFDSSSFNGAYMAISLKNKDIKELLVNELKIHNIQSRSYFSPSLESIFNKSKDYGVENSRQIVESVLCLPLHFYMTISDVDAVVKVVKKVVGEI